MHKSNKPQETPARRDVTCAARAYYTAVSSDVRLFHFLINSVLAGDYVVFTAQRALDGAALAPEMTPENLTQTKPGANTKFLRMHRQAFLQMFVGRFVDTFQKYLVDVIREVLRRKPEILRSRKEVLTVEKLLRFKTIDELVQTIVERKVTGLSYEGFERLREWCVEKGIPLVVTPDDLPIVIELIACRNIIAHNRGIVDERYLEAVHKTECTIGGARNLSVDDIESAIRVLSKVVENLDVAATVKFGLATQPITDPLIIDT